jgi:hypothetical protein
LNQTLYGIVIIIWNFYNFSLTYFAFIFLCSVKFEVMKLDEKISLNSRCEILIEIFHNNR